MQTVQVVMEMTQETVSHQSNLRRNRNMLAAILTHLWIIYPCLMIAALVLNRENKKALLLILLVALTYYLPMKLVADYYMWYGICIGAEIAIIAAIASLGIPRIPHISKKKVRTESSKPANEEEKGQMQFSDD